MVSETSKSKEVEEDWFSFFFDKVELISDEKAQQLWSRILAGEVNSPGTFQYSLLHALSIMSKTQAELFCNIARFCMYEFQGEEVHPLLFISANASAYMSSKITASQLKELENLGLIQCNFNSEYVFLNKKKVFRYGNKVIEVFGDPNNNDKIKAGNVVFTYNGKTLFGIVGEEHKRYRTDILDFTITKLQRRNCKVVLNGKPVL